jgi:hypothetical protein
MSVRSKLVLSGVGVVLVVILTIVAWPVFRAGGYFYRGRCACGHDIFVRIVGDGLFTYSPGHGVPEHRSVNLRAEAEGWAIIGLPHGGQYWSPTEGENEVLGHIRFREGSLWECWGNGTNWTRLPKVHNVLRVWWPKLLKE